MRLGLALVSARIDHDLRVFRTALRLCGFLALIGLASVTDAAQLRLDWTDNSTNESGFSIWRRTETEGTYAPIAARESNATSYVDTTVTEGVTYCYQVLAYNEAGVSAPSNEACATASATSGSTPSAAASAGSGGGGGGCFIATAAFGSPLAPQVQLLRDVRDTFLLPYRPSRVLVQMYYALSPPLADVISRSEMLRSVVRFGLMPILGWAALTLWSPAVGLVIPTLPLIAGIVLLALRSRQR